MILCFTFSSSDATKLLFILLLLSLSLQWQHWFSLCPPFPSFLIPTSTTFSLSTPTSTLHPTFPPPLSSRFGGPPWPLEPFHVVIPLASLGQSPCSSNLMVAGHLHRLQLQASTSSMCPLCHHILSHILFFFCHFDLTFHQLPMLIPSWNTCQDSQALLTVEQHCRWCYSCTIIFYSLKLFIFPTVSHVDSQNLVQNYWSTGVAVAY